MWKYGGSISPAHGLCFQRKLVNTLYWHFVVGIPNLFLDEFLENHKKYHDPVSQLYQLLLARTIPQMFRIRSTPKWLLGTLIKIPECRWKCCLESPNLAKDGLERSIHLSWRDLARVVCRVSAVMEQCWLSFCGAITSENICKKNPIWQVAWGGHYVTQQVILCFSFQQGLQEALVQETNMSFAFFILFRLNYYARWMSQ